jgi:hypothetical protein
MPRTTPSWCLLATAGNFNKFWKLRRKAIFCRSVWVDESLVDVFRIYNRVTLCLFVASESGLPTGFWSYFAGNIERVEDKKQAVKMMISFDRWNCHTIYWYDIQT